VLPPLLDELIELIEEAGLVCFGERQFAHNVRLPGPWNRSVAREGRHDLLMAKVLAPRLELLGRRAAPFGKLRERVPEACGD
jgi:hypothetical protein